MKTYMHTMKKSAAFLGILLLAFVVTAAVVIPIATHADSSQLSGYLQLKNPIGDGATDAHGFLVNVLNGMVLILTPVLVIALIYCGFLFVSAQGNTEKLGEAKQMLIWTLVGAAIILGAKELADVIAHTVGALAG